MRKGFSLLFSRLAAALRDELAAPPPPPSPPPPSAAAASATADENGEERVRCEQLALLCNCLLLRVHEEEHALLADAQMRDTLRALHAATTAAAAWLATVHSSVLPQVFKSINAGLPSRAGDKHVR